MNYYLENNPELRSDPEQYEQDQCDSAQSEDLQRQIEQDYEGK